MRANQASEGLIQYEAGQDLVDMKQMTDSGDHKTFSITEAPWSTDAEYDPVANNTIRPDGLLTGGVVSPGTSNDKIAITDLSCYIGGELVEVGTIAEQDVDRSTEAVPGETYIINSVTVTDAGAIAILQGEEGASFSITRGADGGPPLIPVTSIEIAWVRFSSKTAAMVVASEILQIAGTSCERSNFPVYEANYTEGEITFISALPLIHTGPLPKGVYCQVYTPIFSSLEPASDFVPPETSHSQSSKQVYGGNIGTSSSSLNQGSFTVFLKDGVTDPFLAKKNKSLWFKFFPHRLRSPHILANGTLGIARTFPAGDSIQAACTISAIEAAKDVEE